MQIIQKIRDKGAAIVIVVIALSLIGFILMDANLGSNRMSGSEASSIGEINGASIDSKEFQDKIKQIEDQYGGRITGPQVYMLRQSAWDQLVAEKVLGAEFEKLGLIFSPKELSSIIFSNDAPQSLKQAFTDKTTGVYDIAKVQEWWQSAKKFKGEQRDAIESQVVEPIKIQSQYTKYSGLIAASGYYPTWMKDKETADGKAFSSISYVSVPYNVINDSTIKVSDQDITDYISKRKAQYTEEGGRQISYIAFNATPSATDTAKTLESVASLKNEFIADSNAKVFLSRNMSVKDFDDTYILKSKLTMAQKDSIAALPVGSVYGPYLDGKYFELAKMVSTKLLPDSIKCRHILIGTTDRQTGQPTLADSIAKSRIDSIELAIKGGANFDELESKYSTDQAAHQDKGVMTFDLATMQNKQQFAPEFGSFLLNDNGETKKVVKTSFGWHYIEILEKKNPSLAHKIAFLTKEIVSSEETINTASVNASKLSAEARNAKALEAYIAKNGLQKIDAPNLIKENDYQLGGLQDARQVIKWAFEAKEGDVSEPFSVDEQFVVAVVGKIQPEGLPDARTVRPTVEPTVRNIKKAEQIKAKLGTTPTLESAAAAYNVQVGTAGADSSLTFTATIINGIGQEPKLIGAAFNKAYQAKVSEPIAGTNGVYVIKVNSIGTKPLDAADVTEKQSQDRARTITQQMSYGWFDSLKKLASIKDKRSKIF
jgi:peptidyl-prolyl cis-trans isomerase D